MRLDETQCAGVRGYGAGPKTQTARNTQPHTGVRVVRVRVAWCQPVVRMVPTCGTGFITRREALWRGHVRVMVPRVVPAGPCPPVCAGAHHARIMRARAQ